MGNNPSCGPPNTSFNKTREQDFYEIKTSTPPSKFGGNEGRELSPLEAFLSPDKSLNVSFISEIDAGESPSHDIPSPSSSRVSILNLSEEDANTPPEKGAFQTKIPNKVKPLLASAVNSSTTVSPRMKKSKITPIRSTSTSFDEKFKYKISIYSKVSGCRMTNLADYTIVKQIRVVCLEHITRGDPFAVLNIKFGYEKMKNGGLQVITNDKLLSNALSGLNYFATVPCKVTFPNSPRVVGFIKDLPINMEPSELKREVRKILPEVYSVRYITERSEGRCRPSQKPCAFVSFNLRYLPGFIRVYGKDYEIMVPNPMQCTRCCRYGHQGKQCRAEVRCPICGLAHAKHQCTSEFFRCFNCKGDHPSTSRECSVWQQGKLMNELRYRGGLTAEEAIDVASNGTIQHKKHYFISPNEYFANLENFYSESGSGDGSGEEAEISNSKLSSRDAKVANNEENLIFHQKFAAAQEFLDMMTDFYLKLANPTKNYTSSLLVPGFEDDSALQKLCKKPSRVAQQFKQSVLEAFEEHDNNRFVEPASFK